MLKNEFTNKWKRRLSNKVWLFVLLTGILVLIISVLDVDLSELLEIISPGILALGMALTPADESGQRKFEFRFNRETSDKFKKLARDLAQQRQLSNIFKLVVVQSVELFKAGGGALFLYRPNTDDLAPVFCLNLPDAINSTIIKSGEGLAGHIFKTEQTINVKDYKQWEGAARCFKIDELQAIIGAPISWGNLTLGVLLVLDRPPRIFSRQDITLLEFVTHISAAAIDRLLLKEKSMARLREAEILRQATMAVTESLSLDETLERILKQLDRVLLSDCASVQLIQGDHLTVVAARGFPDPAQVLGSRISMFEDSPNTKVIRAKNPLILSNIQPEDNPFKSLPDIRSWLGVPLVFRSRAIGMLGIYSLNPNSFDKEHIRVANIFASQVAVSIEHAQLFQASHNRLQEMHSLLEISRDITSTLEVDRVLQRVLEAAIEAIEPAQKGVLHLMDDMTGKLVVRASVGFSPEVIKLVTFNPGEGFSGWVYSNQTPIILGNTHADPRTKPIDQKEVEQAISALCVPLIVRGKTIGTLSLNNIEQYHAFSTQHLNLLTVFASQAAVAIDNARLYAEVMNNVDRLMVLNKTVEAIISKLDLAELLELIISQAAKLTNADKSIIFLVDTNEEKVLHVVGFGFNQSEIEGTTFHEISDGISGWILKERKPTISENLLDDPRNTGLAKERLIKTRSISRSLAAAPLLVQEGVIGTLTVINNEGKPIFNQMDLELIAALAGQAAIAIENARLYSEIQRQLQEQIALRESGMIIASTLDPEAVLGLIAEQMAKSVGSTSAYICRYKPETQTSQVIAEYVSPFASEREKMSDFGVEYGEDSTDEWFHLMASGEHDISNVDDPDLLENERSHMIEFGAKTVLFIPLLIKNELIGYVEVWESRYKREFKPHEITLCKGIAQQAAIALENARLYEDANRQARERGFLYDAVTEMGSSMRLDEVSRRTIDALLKVMEPDHISILLIKPGSNQLAIHASYGFNLEPVLLKYMDDETIPDWVVRTGEPLLLTNYQQPLQETKAVRSILCVPLRAGQRTIGALNLECYQPAAFNDENLHLITIVAGQLAAIVENARLVEGLEAEVAAQTAEILAEKEKSDTILRNVGDAIAMFGPDMKIQYVNPAFTELTGYSAYQILGRNIIELFVQEIYQPEWRTLPSIIAQEGSWQGELIIQRKDGRSYDATFTVEPMFDAEGFLVGYVSSHKDISRLKNLNRARQHFLTGVSHQLRTPVTTLKIYTNLLRKNRNQEKYETYLEVIDDQADRLTHLIEDILEITRLDSGQVISTWLPVNVKSLLEDVKAGYQEQAKSAGLALEIEQIAPALPVVNGDLVQLGQALAELLENAINFSPSGSKIVMGVQVVEQEEQPWITIYVRDNGAGIPVNEQKRIFDRFYRGRIAESGHIPGTGLGLCRVKGILEAHGGRVTMESLAGEGSIFTLWLRPVQDAMDRSPAVLFND